MYSMELHNKIFHNSVGVNEGVLVVISKGTWQIVSDSRAPREHKLADPLNYSARALHHNDIQPLD